jgi:hypothetical protein
MIMPRAAMTTIMRMLMAMLTHMMRTVTMIMVITVAHRTSRLGL